MLAPVGPPRRALERDDGMVRAAAGLLRQPEFAFFRLAWRRWYGHEPGDAEIEPHFMLYLYRRRVPVWVRHLAREVVARARHGPVRAEDYGVAPVLPPPVEGGRERVLAALVLALVYGAGFAVVTLAAL